MKFDHSHVGQMTRNENSHMYTANIDRSWTPIRSVTVAFCVGKCTSSKIVRRQFPLRPSAAKTIHRSQGDTEKRKSGKSGNRSKHSTCSLCGFK